MFGASDDESFFGPDLFANDWDDLEEDHYYNSMPSPFSGNNFDLGSMNYNTRTGNVEIKGPAGLFLGILGIASNLMNQGNGGEHDEELRREAEKLRKEKKETAERAAEAEREKEAAAERLKLEEELRALGVEPDHDIKEDDILNARLAIGYIKNHVNIGIVGRQNEGKSTLVNCLRGVGPLEPTSARIGEAEVTRKSTPYLDNKHPGVAWHDIPGGGTRRTSAWGYYYDQQLFAYDKLILVHTSTLSELDIRILKVCKHRGQECIVVRSKADEHIRNCKRNGGHATVEAARNDYIRQVRDDTEAKNKEASKAQSLAPNYKDHIISEMGLRQLVNGEAPSGDPYEQVNDEEELLKTLGLMG